MAKTAFTFERDFHIFLALHIMGNEQTLKRRTHIRAVMALWMGMNFFLRGTPDTTAMIRVPDWSWVPMGAVSFADSVLDYDPGAPGEGTGDEPDPAYQQATKALGPPDYPVDSLGFVSLGKGGTLVLQFTDNVLFDGPGPDLFFWMPDTIPEEAVVFISADGHTFRRAGTVSSESPMLDIQGVAEPGQFYSVLKIRDNAFQGATGTPDLGANIDAVCAIHTGLFHEISAHHVFVDLGDRIHPDANRHLAPVIRDAASGQGVQVLIEIHMDPRGASDFHLALSRQWARTLRNYLLEDLGLTGRVTAAGMGSGRSRASDFTSGRFVHGRIVILIQYKM